MDFGMDMNSAIVILFSVFMVCATVGICWGMHCETRHKRRRRR